jgi:hypothetical protein
MESSTTSDIATDTLEKNRNAAASSAVIIRLRAITLIDMIWIKAPMYK